MLNKKKHLQIIQTDNIKMEHSLEEGNLPEELLKCPPSPSNPSGTKRLCIVGTLQPKDGHLLEDMDVPAVEATRSY